MYIDLTGGHKSEGMLTKFLHQELQKAREEVRQETMRKVMDRMRKLVDDPSEYIYLEEIEETLYELDQSELDQPIISN